MKRILFLFLLLPILGFGQSLSGNYIISPSNADANFKTLASAVARINSVGVSGPVNFLLDENQTVTSQIVIEEISTLSTTNTLTIKPNINKTIIISGGWANTNTAIIKLNGADYVILDGSNQANGITKDLTIQSNLNQGYNAESILWIGSKSSSNGANNNTIKNINFTGNSNQNNNPVFNGIVFASASDVNKEEDVANSNNIITNNTFAKIRNAINIKGNQTTYSKNVTITKNIFGGTGNEITLNAILIDNGQSFLIAQNTIDKLLRTDNSNFIYGINITGKCTNSAITQNKISNIQSTPAGARGINISINKTITSNLLITNNFVSNIYSGNNNMYDSDNGGQGIYIETGKKINVFYNTVSLNVNQNVLSAALFIKDGSNLDIRNNIFVNSQTSGIRYAIYCGVSNAAFDNINYNDYYTSSGGVIGSLSTNRPTLADWQSATTKDQQSKNIQPIFSTSLYLDANSTTNQNLQGIILTSPSDDIDGATRAKPYMGANELVSCSQGDQNTFGNNSWIGYVYNYTGNTPADTDYIGYVTEPTLFDRNIGNGQVNGTTRFICGTPPSDKFFVRYKMKTTTVAGTYNITIGSDDGARLYIDGTLITGLNQWNDHGYTSYAVQQTLTAGVHEFILEYYENAGSSRISFSYGQVNTNVTLNQPYGDKVWNVYGYTTPNFALPASSFAGTYLDTNLNINTTNFWNKAASPSSAASWQGAPVPVDNFTTSHKRKGFPCGRYNIQVVNCDDDTEIYLNGTKLYAAGGNINTPTLISTNSNTFYQLDKNSEVEVRLKENAGDALLVINFIDVPYVYDGSTPPSSGGSIIINDDLALNSNIEVCSCTVAAGKKFTINSDKLLIVNENITVGSAGKLIIKNNGSLVQTNDNATYTGASDSFEMERITKPVYLFDFTYWSSPLTIDSGFTLKKLSTNTLWDKYLYYNPTTGYVTNDNGTEVMVPGKGYLVRAPQDFSRDPSVKALYTANFIGKPNNGINSLNVTAIGAYPTANLIGNPYPSALSADLFYAQNSTLIKGTFYFWTHNTRISATPDANGIYNYSAADYISYNATGSTGSGDITNCTTCGGTKATGSIASGQGFFVEAKASGSLTYNNAMRVKTLAKNSEFSKPSKTQKQATATIEKNRVWLNLKNDAGQYNEMLLGYITGATNDKDDAYDGSSYASGTAIYSILDNENLVIQGRALPFDEAEIIPLGIITSAAGEYTIGIESLDGFFQNQRVYLTDKTTSITTNLKDARYSFKSESGTFNDRFTLSFTQKTLGIDTAELAQSGIVIFNKNHQVQISSNEQNIESVVIYDILGKTIYKKDTINNTTFSTGELKFPNQVVIVKVKTENNSIITKKIIL